VPDFQPSAFNLQPVPPSRASGGFALLVTITLLAFVVLLLVGLATYTRIETAISGNTQKLAQARQNALLAFDVALGQLQLHAGPDQRVTATADSFGGIAGKLHYTGVWDSTATGPAARTWLVSGNETNPLAVTPTNALTAANAAELIGLKTSAIANDVRAPLVPITTVGVPGQSTSATIGRYAWWVGDQGVKAPVALAGSTTAITYAPYDSADPRDRIRQQISLGAGASDTTGTPVFEPRAVNNATLVANTTALNQLAFFNKTTTGTVGLTTLQQRHYDWTPNNYNVLANTSADSLGLRRDLSLDASPLGAAAQAWLDYTSYMEAPAASATSAFPPVPQFGTDPLRRRYRITSPVSSGGAVASVSPVLAQCGLSFNIRTVNGQSGQSLEIRARWYVSLWNPYTAALVPEDLTLEIEGLPDPILFTVTDTTTGLSLGTAMIRPYQLFADTTASSRQFPLKLSWPAATSNSASDYLSWLPGRVYTWISNPSSLLPTPPGGLDGSFYVTNFSTVAGQGDTRLVPGPTYSSASSLAGTVSFAATSLVAKLYRASDASPLAIFSPQPFQSVLGTAPQVITSAAYQFGFQFRLFESGHVDVGDKGVWLNGPLAVDLRSANLPATSFRLDPTRSDDPAQYQTSLDFADAKFLLDRTQGAPAIASVTYNEDVPVFELPRAPLLSLGALQHLALDGARPFSIGNSWGAATPLNTIPSAQLFDRFFFSGLVPAIAPTGSGAALVLPNPLLRVSPRKADGTATTVADLRGAANATSSQFLLQGGAFNLNSTSLTAWAAVLRGVRFPAPAAFNYVDADAATGTASANGEVSATPLQSSDAQFFRFSQSAQETYKAEPNLAAGLASPASTANTQLFRNGVITLDTTKVTALATAISTAIKTRHAAGGPFRTLAEFLSPAAAGGTSLLEDAIATAGINSSVAEFSSQFLTQGDIMTALAPVLFPRSDTFVIRTYGEAVNPATGVTEGRAWCEATVQRVPDYFDPVADTADTAPAALTSALNQNYGRRFKVVSFRWLTRSDI
jgi:hypothetical protein